MLTYSSLNIRFFLVLLIGLILSQPPLFFLWEFLLIPNTPTNKALFFGLGSTFCLTIFTYFFFLKHLEQKLDELNDASSYFQDLFESIFNTQQASLITDAWHSTVWTNRAFNRHTGYRKHALENKMPQYLNDQMIDEVNATGNWSGEVDLASQDFSKTRAHLNIKVISADADGPLYYLHTFEGMVGQGTIPAPQKEVLIGAAGRAQLIEYLRTCLEVTEKNGTYNGLLVIGIDKLSELNTSLGHTVGDQFLEVFSAQLSSNIEGEGRLFRLSGNEFLIVFNNLGIHLKQAHKNLELLTKRIHEVSSDTYSVPPHEHYVTTSIGTYLFTGASLPPEELIRRAEIAINQAKKSGGNCITHFDFGMKSHLDTRAEIYADLHSAIPNNQLELYYQIQVNQAMQPIGVEALMRWHHPHKEMISPGIFIPIAEESALIEEMGSWGLEESCKLLSKWEQSPKYRHLQVAFNVSAKQFKRRDFVEKLDSFIRRYKVNPKLLKLELTESLALDNFDEAISKMHEVKDKLGVTLSLDDFGTGYSSLSYLKKMPFDQLKIDQSFVRTMTSDPESATLVKTIIEMARNLNLEVIAEGVENHTQVQMLSAYGCTNYQGYLFGKPVPLEVFENSLGNIPH